jgi:hypothetical protein
MNGVYPCTKCGRLSAVDELEPMPALRRRADAKHWRTLMPDVRQADQRLREPQDVLAGVPSRTAPPQ